MRWRRGLALARRALNRVPVRETQKIHVLTLLIGGLCGLAAVAFHVLLDLVQEHVIYAVAAKPSGWQPLFCLLVPALGALLVGVILHFYAPEARGSGIPQVKVAFVRDDGRIPLRVIPAKMVLSALNIGTGASLGREGPTVQICAAMASAMGRAWSLSRSHLRSLIPVGAAAGLAAAFNTPIAAVTFTLEEILGDTAAKPLGSIVVASVVAAVVERSLLGEHALFNVPPYKLAGVGELPFYLLLGVLAGAIAVAFNSSLLRLRAWFRQERRIPQWAAPAVGGLAVGLLGLIGLTLTGSASVFGVGYRQLAIGLQGDVPLRFMAALCILKLAATVVSYGSGSSGGIFGPSLFIGGMLGGAVGMAAQASTGMNSQPGAFALVGMGAVFAGIVRAPITSIVIIFEMTQNYSMILPLMAANVTSYALARRLQPSPIYDALLAQDGIRHLHAPAHSLRALRVRSAMARDFPRLLGSWTIARASAHLSLLHEQRASYPVLDDGGSFLGMVPARDLLDARADLADVLLNQLARPPSALAHLDQSLESVVTAIGRSDEPDLPVVSRRNPARLVGLISLRDVAVGLARAAAEDQRP